MPPFIRDDFSYFIAVVMKVGGGIYERTKGESAASNIIYACCAGGIREAESFPPTVLPINLAYRYGRRGYFQFDSYTRRWTPVLQLARTMASVGGPHLQQLRDEFDGEFLSSHPLEPLPMLSSDDDEDDKATPTGPPSVTPLTPWRAQPSETEHGDRRAVVTKRDDGKLELNAPPWLKVGVAAGKSAAVAVNRRREVLQHQRGVPVDFIIKVYTRSTQTKTIL
jgi:hypothetical protein